jgi:deoxyribonuclease-4
MAGVPVVVETPSELDGSPSAGHARDIALLRSLIEPVVEQRPAA